MTLEQNSIYNATITLSPGQAFFANKTVVEVRLKEVGFVDVTVRSSESKNIYEATGKWGKPTQEVDVPKMISNIEKI